MLTVVGGGFCEAVGLVGVALLLNTVLFEMIDAVTSDVKGFAVVGLGDSTLSFITVVGVAGRTCETFFLI